MVEGLIIIMMIAASVGALVVSLKGKTKTSCCGTSCGCKE